MRIAYPKPQIYWFWPGQSNRLHINNDVSFLRNFHEKMKFPKFIQDHPSIIPGPPRHQITSFGMHSSFRKHQKHWTNDKLKNWSRKWQDMRVSAPKAMRFRFLGCLSKFFTSQWLVAHISCAHQEKYGVRVGLVQGPKNWDILNSLTPQN